jgi:hypothetical protein
MRGRKDHSAISKHLNRAPRQSRAQYLVARGASGRDHEGAKGAADPCLRGPTAKHQRWRGRKDLRTRQPTAHPSTCKHVNEAPPASARLRRMRQLVAHTALVARAALAQRHMAARGGLRRMRQSAGGCHY